MSGVFMYILGLVMGATVLRDLIDRTRDKD